MKKQRIPALLCALAISACLFAGCNRNNDESGVGGAVGDTASGAGKAISDIGEGVGDAVSDITEGISDAFDTSK